MLFSIIIPCYNVEKYIRRCLGSVYSQDINESEYEVLIVDDESPDNVVEVAKEFLKDQQNFQIISQKNKGLGGARNTGINNAKGKYLLFLDADDWLNPGTLKTLQQRVSGEEIIEFGNSIVFNDPEKTKNNDFSDSSIMNGLDYLANQKSINSACNKTYKLAFLRSHKILFSEKIYGEDFEFNTYSFFFASKVKSIKDNLISFYQSSSSITRNSDLDAKLKYALDYVKIIENLTSFSQAYSQSKKETDFINTRITEKNVTVLVLFLKNRLPYAKFREIKNGLKAKGLFILKHSLRNKRYNLIRKTYFAFPWLFESIIYLKSKS